MRRAVLLGGVTILLVAAWLSLRPSDDEWIVAVHADNGLVYEEPCLPMDEIIDGGATSGGGFDGLYKVASRADGQVVADCYEDHGVEATVRRMTKADRETWDELMG